MLVQRPSCGKSCYHNNYHSKKMVITFPGLFLRFAIVAGIQSVSFTSGENKRVKQRRINTVDFILVVMVGGFVSSFLREVQSTIEKRCRLPRDPTRIPWEKQITQFSAMFRTDDSGGKKWPLSLTYAQCSSLRLNLMPQFFFLSSAVHI